MFDATYVAYGTTDSYMCLVPWVRERFRLPMQLET